jgi:hypothetical protein
MLLHGLCNRGMEVGRFLMIFYVAGAERWLRAKCICGCFGASGFDAPGRFAWVESATNYVRRG